MKPIFSRVLALVRGVALVPIVLALGAAGASAAPIVVTFDSDAVDLIAGNDFSSDALTQIHFVDTVPGAPGQGDMFIVNEAFTNYDNALAVGFGGVFDEDGNLFEADDSALRILLDFPATSISMDLLVADPGSLGAGDQAVLTAFDEGGEVGSASVVLSSAGSIEFNSATFFNRVDIQYVVPGGLTEIVDNVSVTPAVPEPHAAIVFGVGALVVGAACKRRSRADVGLRERRRRDRAE